MTTGTPADRSEFWPQTADKPGLIALCASDYAALVRLTALLIRDVAGAELIVADAFVALSRWRRNPDAVAARRFLQQAVVRQSRSVVRRRAGVHRHAHGPAPSAGRPACAGDQLAVISALWTLPARQREVVILSHYAGLADREIAAVTGLTSGAVRRYLRRGVAELSLVLEGRAGRAAASAAAGTRRQALDMAR